METQLVFDLSIRRNFHQFAIKIENIALIILEKRFTTFWIIRPSPLSLCSAYTYIFYYSSKTKIQSFILESIVTGEDFENILSRNRNIVNRIIILSYNFLAIYKNGKCLNWVFDIIPFSIFIKIKIQIKNKSIKLFKNAQNGAEPAFVFSLQKPLILTESKYTSEES